MRVLFAIPHYVSQAGDATTHARKHGSVAGGTERRALALTACLTALQQSLRPTHWIIDHSRSITFKVYKPALSNADLLEVQHHGTGYIEQLCPPPAAGERP